MHVTVPAGKLVGSILLGLVVLVPILLIVTYWQWVLAILAIVLLVAGAGTVRAMRKARVVGSDEHVVDQAGRVAFSHAFEVEKELGATDGEARRAAAKAMMAAQSAAEKRIAANRDAAERDARAAAYAAVARRRGGN